MNAERIAGAVKRAKGAAIQSAGKLTGNRRVEAHGASEKAVGLAKARLARAEDMVLAALLRH